ncbi:hypothetical protein Tco_0161967 [Tanacetum coccineum]
MENSMSSDTKLTKEGVVSGRFSTKYRGMIGSLLYLTASRPDIMFSICLCARFQEDPKTSHLEAVKCIFRYIKSTTHLGLWYPKGTSIETVVYADSDHAGDYVDRKDHLAVFVGFWMLSDHLWFLRKQNALVYPLRRPIKSLVRVRVSLVTDGPFKPTFLLDDISRMFEKIREGQVHSHSSSEGNESRKNQEGGVAREEVSAKSRPYCYVIPFRSTSSSHLNDDDDDGNDEGDLALQVLLPHSLVISHNRSCSLVFQNPPTLKPRLEPFFTVKLKSSTRKYNSEMSIGGVRFNLTKFRKTFMIRYLELGYLLVILVLRLWATELAMDDLFILSS